MFVSKPCNCKVYFLWECWQVVGKGAFLFLVKAAIEIKVISVFYSLLGFCCMMYVSYIIYYMQTGCKYYALT